MQFIAVRNGGTLNFSNNVDNVEFEYKNFPVQHFYAFNVALYAEQCMPFSSSRVAPNNRFSSPGNANVLGSVYPPEAFVQYGRVHVAWRLMDLLPAGRCAQAFH